jgi:asparagine synthase (glutamine-hydrolysing)
MAEAPAGCVDADLARRLRGLGATYGGGGRPAVWSDGGVAFVHVPRPATPEDGLDRLPGRFAGGTAVLAFDGRLDNRDDLIAGLALDRERAATMGDGALAMAAIERWGDHACARLIGDFALAWWDERSRRLVLACDATGGRTLYVHADGGRLCFATHPLAVLAFPGVPREINPVAVACAMAATQPPAGTTPYRDVFRLPPAGLLTWRDGAFRVERYWRLDPARRIRYRDSRDYEQAARELLDRAVAAQARVIGPLVCQLSGGLDSGAVVATAARLCPATPIHALTSQPNPGAPLPILRRRDRILDEGPLAATTASLYPNVVHHVLPAGELTPEEIDPTRLFEKTGLPVRNYLNLGGWQPAFAKARELNARALLIGSSGNATLSWEDLPNRWRLRRHLVENVLPPAWRRAWRQWHGRHPDPILATAALRPEWARQAAGIAAARKAEFSIFPGRHNFNIRLRFIEDQWARRPYHAALTAATGCELRDPLSDRRLTEFCFAIPFEQWGLGGVPRSFARRVLADRLPPAVLGFMGRGYQCPDWFHRLGGLRETFVADFDRLEASRAASAVLDLARLRALAEDWPADVDAAERRRDELLVGFGRGSYYGRFIRWVEGGNG